MAYVGDFYYVDKDHLGDEELYNKLDVPDPEAPLSQDSMDETKSKLGGSS